VPLLAAFVGERKLSSNPLRVLSYFEAQKLLQFAKPDPANRANEHAVTFLNGGQNSFYFSAVSSVGVFCVFLIDSWQADVVQSH